MAWTRVTILLASLLLLSGLALSKGQKKLNMLIMAVTTTFKFKNDSSQVDLNCFNFLFVIFKNAIKNDI